MRKKGTILRYFKEKAKKYFKIIRDCKAGKFCQRNHFRGKKIVLKKVFQNGEFVYNFRNIEENNENSNLEVLTPNFREDEVANLNQKDPNADCQEFNFLNDIKGNNNVLILVKQRTQIIT